MNPPFWLPVNIFVFIEKWKKILFVELKVEMNSLYSKRRYAFGDTSDFCEVIKHGHQINQCKMMFGA